MLLTFLSVLISLILLIISIIENFKLKKKNKKIDTLEDYNKTLLKMNDNISGFKHDFSNFVQALDGYVETNNLTGVKTMSSAILKECVNTKSLESLNPNIIKNAGVYSIISKKYFLAQSKDVVMNIEILTDLQNVEKISYEICRILAILLDNAIEAASKCETKEIYLRILQDSKVDRKLIIIENTYMNKEVDVDKIFEKGNSSKEKEFHSHGLGLWNVRKILNKHSNLNLFTSKGKLFIQQLEIYK